MRRLFLSVSLFNAQPVPVEHRGSVDSLPAAAVQERVGRPDFRERRGVRGGEPLHVPVPEHSRPVVPAGELGPVVLPQGLRPKVSALTTAISAP